MKTSRREFLKFAGMSGLGFVVAAVKRREEQEINHCRPERPLSQASWTLYNITESQDLWRQPEPSPDCFGTNVPWLDSLGSLGPLDDIHSPQLTIPVDFLFHHSHFEEGARILGWDPVVVYEDDGPVIACSSVEPRASGPVFEFRIPENGAGIALSGKDILTWWSYRLGGWKRHTVEVKKVDDMTWETKESLEIEGSCIFRPGA